MKTTFFSGFGRRGTRPAAAATVDTGWLPAGSGFTGASWFAPVGPRPRQAAVLIVPGIAYEERTMIEGLAALARALAATGFGSLLIDLHGTAQASGRLDAADIGERWQQDIRSALGHLRAGGFESVIVVGVRIGALLARAALKDEALAGFVAWAPVMSGRRHARELKMLNASGVASGGGEEGPSIDGVSVGAHDIPDAVLTHLAALSFDLDIDASRQPLLVVGEGDAQPPAGPAAQRLAAELQRWLFTPQDMPITPQLSIQTVVGWCKERDRLDRPARTHSSRRRPRILKEISLACDGLAVRERTVRFGRAGLSGVVTEPLHQPSVGAVRLLATLVGPGRLFPTMAREEAVRGKTSMRFDFAGFSSSGHRPDGSGGELYSPKKRDDIAEAVACLRRLGHEQVTMVGFCAGAWSMIQAADLPNVSGVVGINAQLYRQPDYRLRDVVLRAGHPLAKTLALLRRVSVLTRKVEWLEQFRIPAGMETGRWLRRLGDMAVPRLLIYAADDAGLVHLDRRFGSAAVERAAPRRSGVRRVHEQRVGDRIPVGRYSGLGHSLEGRLARGRMMEAIQTHLADVDARLGAEPLPAPVVPTRATPGNGTRLAASPAAWEGLSWAHSR